MEEKDIEKLVEAMVEKKMEEKFSAFSEDFQKLEKGVKTLNRNQQKEKVTLLITSFELDQL